MRTLSHLAILILIFSQSTSSQTITHLVCQPGPLDGIDADIQSTAEFRNNNFGDKIWVRGTSWTRNGGENLIRGLISFPLDDLLAGADSIDEARIVLFKDPDYPWSNGGAYGDNECQLHIVTEPWDENTVTWTNQPEFSSIHYVTIPRNNDYDSIEVDITPLVELIMEGEVAYHGFLLKSTIEQSYRSMSFFSSDSDSASLRPKLEVEYYSSKQGLWSVYQNDIFYNSGNVSIGTHKAHDYRLFVNGDLFSNEIVVDPDFWPDFVFEDDYKLMPLNDLEDYVRTNRRLPHVPSADKVKSKGVELSANSAMLLQKIEELTLYLLEQNRKHIDLLKRIEVLEESLKLKGQRD